MGEAIRLRVNNEIPAYRTGLVAALDVGTSKVACVIGRAEQGSLKILGSALRESAGLRAGTVTSLDLAEESIRDCVAATSVGLVNGEAMLDLCYQEDSRAEVDMNVVMTGAGQFVELQATAEKTAFDDTHLASLLGLARRGIAALIEVQRKFEV